MSHYRDALESIANHGRGGWCLMRHHLPERVQALGDKINERLKKGDAWRMENERLRQQVDGLRGEMDRLTAHVLELERETDAESE